MEKAQVLIILGSKSDTEAVSGCGDLLRKFGIPFRQEISSAHRQPARTIELVKQSERDGVKIIIAAAGMAAHLPGVIASHTLLPVIGVPLAGSALGGVDSLLSVVQMPAGIPVATMAVGSHGARNAAVLAVEILALSDPNLKVKLEEYRRELSQG
ncbi:MAG: 5-(carboxyamino)imidazole ribonucleotide mutase [candidate division Zixibacteria bacterium RBG_16_53_22]|nr:MAG: 5-(carboxyamino)imidazole ribonucleotide mutase [candidate division Zixibacteria bacterium RBG_16_53_22]